MSAMTGKSPAKINLTLRVEGRRADGFHEIESLVARVGLCDTITVAPRDDGQLALTCDDPSVPCDETNLAVRAARCLAETADVRSRGADITLQKRIPAGAGLGGGSSNAATVLTLLNELWKTGLSPAELAQIGARIGSDVSLFFHTPLCIVRGRGERIEDLPRSLSGWAVLILPAIHSPTAEVYAAWDHSAAHPTRPSLSEVLRHAHRPETLMPHLFNDLEEPALAVRPELARLTERLSQAAGGPVRMTGSGSAFFRLFDERASADAFGELVLQRLNLPTTVVPFETD